MENLAGVLIGLQLLIATLSYTQEGFIRAYSLGHTGMTFHNMLLVEDTLVIVGEALKEDNTQWGVLFCKMDTSGNILDYKVHYDTLGDSYVFDQGYQIIRTSDKGYAFVGMNFSDGYTPMLFKLDQKGEMVFAKEYPDTTTFTKRHWNLVEFDRGYITTGVKQQADDYKWDAFIMRVDEEGDKVWEISYGENGVYDA